MALHIVERALWIIGNEPAATREFLADKAAFLARFNLDDEERELISALDVVALSRRGVHALLLINAYQTVFGAKSIPEYMMRMGAGG
jgi:hypothetical protein